MINFKRSMFTLATVAALISSVGARAGTVEYNGYNVLNNSSATISSNSGNELVGSGQIQLNTTTGMLSTWCVDVYDYLKTAGVFNTGTYMTGEVADKINALLSNGEPMLSSGFNVSSALQIAVWRVEYSDLTITAQNSNTNALADSYISHVNDGTWQANGNMAVALLMEDGNQIQAYLTAVPEPASMMLMAVGLLGYMTTRRRATQA